MNILLHTFSSSSIGSNHTSNQCVSQQRGYPSARQSRAFKQSGFPPLVPCPKGALQEGGFRRATVHARGWWALLPVNMLKNERREMFPHEITTLHAWNLVRNLNTLQAYIVNLNKYDGKMIATQQIQQYLSLLLKVCSKASNK